MRPLLSVVLALLSAGPLQALTLSQAYDLALKRSEELAQRGETAGSLAARVDELWSYLKPRLTVAASELVQDVPPAASGLNATFTQRSREQAQLTLHQPIFSGFREFLAIRGARLQTRSAEHQLARARQLVYQDAAEAFLELLGARREIAIRSAILGILDDRIGELRERRKLGRSRPSELLAARSQRALAAAQLEGARGAERLGQAKLRFVTGLERDADPEDPPAPALEGLEALLSRAPERPDVLAARAERDAQALAVGVSARQRWPTLSLDGNYYLKRPPGFQQDVSWDATVSAALPLYAGGQVGAQTRQAEALRRSRDQALSLALRRAQLEIRSAHEAMATTLSVSASLVEAEELAAANAKAQSEDYRLGLVTNLDVMGALSALQETRLRLDVARREALAARARLDVAAGLPGAAP